MVQETRNSEPLPRPSKTQLGDEIIICTDVHKWFGSFHVLNGITASIRQGEVVVVFGPSGSGKSTFIRTINRLEEHQRGQIIVDGIELTNDIRNIEAIRREIGMVFQQFNLFPHMTAMRNVAFGPMKVRKLSKDQAERRALTLLDRVGLADKARSYPNQLSGGQQQRVAVARALVSRPSVMFADEPTGNLDSTTGGEILALLRDSVDSLGQTTVMVTHDAHAAAIADRVLFLADGRIVRDLGRSSAHEILDALEGVTRR